MSIEIHERLKLLRKRNNVSQNKLAQHMQLTRAAINAWENGVNCPHAQSLIILADYFNVSVDYLLGIDDSEMLNISRLNESEKEMICDIVKYLKDIKK